MSDLHGGEGFRLWSFGSWHFCFDLWEVNKTTRSHNPKGHNPYRIVTGFIHDIPSMSVSWMAICLLFSMFQFKFLRATSDTTKVWFWLSLWSLSLYTQNSTVVTSSACNSAGSLKVKQAAGLTDATVHFTPSEILSLNSHCFMGYPSKCKCHIHMHTSDAEDSTTTWLHKTVQVKWYKVQTHVNHICCI